MTPGRLRAEVIADRAASVRDMVVGVRALPLESLDAFRADARNVASAESYLRRALEAELDLGRHVLSKVFGRAPAEYKQVAEQLVEEGVLDRDAGALLRVMAGYRNRLVHFYDRVSVEELYQICVDHIGDLERLLEGILAWVRANGDVVDGPTDVA